jgi:hypothetical protein
MSQITAKMVPRILTDDQKQRRFHISSDLLYNADMFDRVITSDETWCFQYHPKENAVACSGKFSFAEKKHACLARS